MLTDYKTPRVTQHDDGSWTVLLRIYEGDVTTENELDKRGNMVPVTRYRRIAVLREETLEFQPMPEVALHGLLRVELAKDLTRQPIEEQRDA